MCARPRSVSDEQVFAAAMRLMSRLPPSELTLAAIGAEAGLTAGALVQRFGSKRGLMLALAGSSVEFVDACFARIRDANPAPLAALRVAATHMASMVESPESLANHLAFLQIDLSDPDFHALALDNHLRIEAGYRALLDDAVAAGELAPCDTARLARAVGAVAGGSLIGWAITRGGDVVTHVREDVDTLLAPYAAAAARTSAAPARRRHARTSS